MHDTPENDPLTARAMLKWPNVPASHGWLGLDARGRWRIRGEPISHPGIVAFLARQYRGDSTGAWYVQNGPQRAFVDLELAPWVLRLDGAGALVTHTGARIAAAHALLVSDTGHLYLVTPAGAGVVSDRDLAAFLGCLVLDGHPGDSDAVAERLLALTAGTFGPWLTWHGCRLQVRGIADIDVERACGFVRRPRPRDDRAAADA
ncbi:MAG: DUF2946 family protein [Gammaproteobacteria bacterium]